MTQASPGWYPDPGAPPGAPPYVRYWDGSSWTHHVQPAYAAQPPATGAARPTGPTTPDGQPLSGWWWRVLAYLIDTVAVGILGNLVTIPAQVQVQGEMNDLVDRWADDVERGGTTDLSTFWSDLSDIYRDHALLLVGLPLLLTLAYFVLFLRWKGATPGQLACGLRVRLRERPGTLPWSTVLTRVGAQALLPWGVLTLGLLSGSLGMFVLCYLGAVGWFVIDSLWATWNRNRQTLHDLIARTQVVRLR
jgi:uncharacterized RDD family membrane protein YckC